MKVISKVSLLALALTLTTSAFAQDEPTTEITSGLLGEEPVIEHRPDRVIIFPQRMALDDTTSVMDLLMMFL